MSDAETQVRNYILDNFLFTEDQSQLANDDSFLEKGIVDSTGMLEVILFLEDDFEITVKDDEMVPANLDSVSNILKFIQSKQA